MIIVDHIVTFVKKNYFSSFKDEIYIADTSF